MWKILTEEERQQELEHQQRLEKFKPILDKVSFDEMLLVDNEIKFWKNRITEFFDIMIDETNDEELLETSKMLNLEFFNALSEEKRERYIFRRNMT